MGYRNVKEVLPDDLIKKIQEYIDGENVYIPKKEIRNVNPRKENIIRNREIFEKHREEFSYYVQEHYDNAKTYHDGKWMFFDVNTMDQLDEMKKLIQIKKKPNRKMFPKDNAVYTQCGHRCDLCIHYSNLDEQLRSEIEPHLVKMWDQTDWSMRCGGCYSPDCYCKNDLCGAKRCAYKKGITECIACEDYPCEQATVGDYRSKIHTEVHYADEITWGILPYVPWQYEKTK